MFIYSNLNPLNLTVGDCVVRAISALLNQDWDTTYIGLATKGYEMADMPYYSYAAQDKSTIDYESETEFGRLIDGKVLNEFLSFIDEFFSQLLITYNPDLYNYVIRKLKE